MPRHLFIDAECSLIPVLKDGLNLTRDNLWEKHKIDITTVAATDHHAHGLVERRMQDFHNYIGKLDTSGSDLTPVDLYNYF